jgi:hypothetical protein
LTLTSSELVVDSLGVTAQATSSDSTAAGQQREHIIIILP